MRRFGLQNGRNQRHRVPANDSLIRSIRRGSADWSATLRPFVSSLAFRCVSILRAESEPSFFPWRGHCAVLFVDLSGYSKVTSALAHKGAFVLSRAVNEYLERLLLIVQEYGGDVVKFAGDAILIVWEGDKEEMDLNVLCAAQCAIQMQERAGTHAIKGTDLSFRVHIGLSCGELDTQIFEAPTHIHMQRLYHAVGGEPLEEIGDLVEAAEAGEVCISQECHIILKASGTFRRCGPYASAQILTSLNVTDENEERIRARGDKLVQERERYRNNDIQEDFVPPSVLDILVHSGNSPTQIAQMRNLCVLFIGMTSTGYPVNWLLEVQGVLDKHRCPIVQIINDDKGVHVIAAINLYHAVPNATTLALDAARELLQQEVGCAIGMAMGSTFCGVTGCSLVACRWDITGFPVVRAARLMQWAISEEIAVAIDETVYNATVASNRMDLVAPGVTLKGTREAIPVFTLSQSTNFAASMIMEHTTLAPLHNEVVDQVYGILSGSKPRGVAVISGPPLVGKKALCQRAAGRASLVPILHTCDPGEGHLQLARTIVTWYRHCNDQEVRDVATIVEDHLNNGRWSRAHDECVRLFNVVMVAGYHGCFIVDRCQFLDDFSMSLMRDCIGGSIRTRIYQGNSSGDSLGSSISEGSVEGKIFFLCIHIPLYKWRTDHCFVYDMKRTRDIDVSTFRVAEVPMNELRNSLKHCFDIDATENWFSVFTEQSGYSAGFFLKRVDIARLLSTIQSKEGKLEYSMINSNLCLFIPPEMVRHQRRLNMMQVSSEIGMRFTQGFDELPPRYQTFMKVLGILPSKTLGYACPLPIMSEIMDDIFDDGVDSEWLEIVLFELRDLYMIKVHGEGSKREISLYYPALADVVIDVSTTRQVNQICTAILARLEPRLADSFEVPLVCAALCGHLKDDERQQSLWKQSYRQLLDASSQWTESHRNSRKLLLQHEIENASCCPTDVLGMNFMVTVQEYTPANDLILRLNNYTAPISCGPMGHTFTVISRCAFREIRAFLGDATDDEIEKIRYDSESAFNRFKQEVSIVEDFLRSHGCGETDEFLQKELELMEKCVKPGHSDRCVELKADIILEQLVPLFIEPRMKRLYQACAKLREVSAGEEAEIMIYAPNSIRMAYAALCNHEDQNDAVQHVLITLATLNWVPRKLPEDLPPFHYQTTARIRDAVLRRLNKDELALFKHQLGALDLEAFLVTTAILTLSCERSHKGDWYAS